MVSNMSEEPRRQGAAPDVVGEWLARLEVARRMCRLYDPEHRATMRARQQLWSATTRLPERELVVLVTPAGFELPGRSLGALAKASAHLASQLWRLGIKAVRVRPPVAADVVERLLRLLTDLTDRPSEEDRARVLEDEKELGGVDLLPVVMDGLVYVEDDEPGGAPPGDDALRSGGDGRMIRGGRGSGGVRRAGVAEGGVEVTSHGDGDAIDELLALLDRPPQEAGDGSDLLLAVERVFAGTGSRVHHGTARDAASVLDGTDELFEVGGAEDTRLRSASATPRSRSAVAPPRRVQVPASIPPGWRPPTGRGERSAGAPLEQSSFGQRRHETPESARVPAYHRHPLLRKTLATRPPGWPEQQLGDHAVRRHVDLILMAAHHLWPESEIAARAHDGLVRRYFERLELGEFEPAFAIAHDLVTAGDHRLPDRLAGEDGLEALLEALAVWGKEHRREVARIAGLLGVRLVPHIGRALATEERMSHRRRMLEMMLAIGAPAIPQVEAWLRDERWYVVRNGLFVLRHLKAPDLAAAAAPLSDHAEPKVAAEAIRCLAVAGDPRWRERFRELMGRHSSVARREAFTLASILRDDDLGRVLLQELARRKGLRLADDETLDLITALGRFPLPDVSEELRRLADLPNWRYPFRLTPVWEAVARAAAHQPSPAAEEILDRLARRRDPAAELARQVLARRQEEGA